MDESTEINVEPEMMLEYMEDDDYYDDLNSYNGDYYNNQNGTDEFSSDQVDRFWTLGLTGDIEDNVECNSAEINPTPEYVVIEDGNKRFQCLWTNKENGEVCEKTFSRRSNLTRHLKCHSKNKVQVSARIAEQFTKSETTEAKSDEDEEKDSETSDHSPNEDNELKQNNHVSSRSPRKLKECPHCRKMYSSKYLKNHIMTHTGERPYKCTWINSVSGEKCEKSFIRPDNLQRHINTHSVEKDKLNTTLNTQNCDELDPLAIVATEISVEPEFMPMYFDGENNSEAEYNYYDDRENGVELLLHAKQNNQETTKAPQKKECPDCGKFYSTKHMKSHRMTHTGLKPFKCQICLKDFARRDNLKKHLRVHSRASSATDNNQVNGMNGLTLADVTMKRCTYCDKMYVESYMSTHIRTHTGKMPFSDTWEYTNFSDELGKCYVKLDQLEYPVDHYNGELEERNVQSPWENIINYKEEYGRCFVPLERLTTDVLSQYGVTLFYCNYCPKFFPLASNLKRHEFYHAPYRCKINGCPQSFQSFSELLSHRKTHSESGITNNTVVEKKVTTTLQCDICFREFSKKDSLRRHQWLHLDTRPYTCEICGRGFIRQDQLKLHESKHY